MTEIATPRPSYSRGTARPTTDGFLPIDASARASSISVRALRNYHQSRLLVPRRVDDATGYQAYSVDQLADAVAIVRLRELAVPLPMVQGIRWPIVGLADQSAAAVEA